jgi:hypothetical protein
MNSSYICDYITVFFEDGNISANVGEWYIPPSSYYYQSRGTLALVSVADATFDADGDSNFLIAYDNGFNGTIAQVNSGDLMPNNVSILGSMVQSSNQSETSDGLYHYNRTEAIKVLTAARPNKIKLSFWKDNKQERDVERGSVTLKFEYLSPEAEQEVNQAVSYVPAFPEPTSF